MRRLKNSYWLSGVAFLVIGFCVLQFNKQSNSSIQTFLEMSNAELNELPKYDRPDLADLHNFEMTKDPKLGFPPAERLFTAKKYADNLRIRARAGNSTWVERGPNNFGGRTRAIMFDPNDPFSKKVWAAGVAGGIWWTDDITSEYVSWNSVNDFFGNIAINSMAHDPQDPNVFYFGTGEGWGNADAVRGNGIWKSTDGGLTWNQLASTADNDQFFYVQKLLVTNQSTLLAATRTAGGIMRSTDGGQTWERVIEESRGADLEISGNIIYASTGVGTAGKMWKSTDDGETWEEITPEQGKNRIEIGVHPNHPNTVYAVAAQGSNVGGLYRSYDAGDNWTPITIPPYTEQSCDPSNTNDFTRGQAWYDLIVAVDPTDKNTLIVGGIDINKSTDGGKTWDLISYWTGACDDYVHADQHNFLFRPGHPDFAIAATDGGIYYTESFSRPISEGGPIFTARNLDYNVAQFYACAMENQAGSNYFLAGAQDNGSHQFFGPGINSTNEITGGDGAFCFIDQDNSDIQITSFVYNSYWITRDGWDDNDRVEFGGSVGRFINPADYSNEDDILYAAGDDDQMIRYVIPESGEITAEDLSVSLNGGAPSAITVSKYDPSVLFIGTGDGEVFKVTDASGSPLATMISTTAIPEDVYISSIDIGASDDEIIVTASNYGIESVFLTRDGGANWSTKEGNLPDMPIRWALFNPSDYEQVLLATELGVWSTNAISDETPTWTVINDGLANVRCDMLQIRESDGLIAVATHGRGLFTSDIWATISTPNFSSVDLAYEGAEIAFFDASVKATSYLWDFGDGSTSTSTSPVHTFSSPGSYEVSLQINGDPLLVTTKTLNVLPSLSSNYELADGGDFEVNTDHFSAVTLRGTGFELGSSTIEGKSGTNSGDNAWVTGLTETQYEPNGEAYLYSPVFDFGLSGDYTIEFYTKYAIEDEWEGFTVEYSTDFGRSWRKLGDYLDEENWYNQQALSSAVVWTPGENFFSGDTGDEFVKKFVTTSALSNTDNVAFRFVFKTDPGTEEAGIAIDDFRIIPPSESTPSLGVANSGDVCLGEVVIFENQSVGDIQSYTWSFGEGANPSTAVGYGPHEVLYSSEGSKNVELVGSTSGGNISIQSNVEIFSLPADPEITQDNFEICAQEEVIIEIQNTQNDLSYSLYSIDSKEFVGEGVAGNDGTLSLSTGAIQSGTFEYRVFVSNANNCEVSGELITVFSKENPPIVIIEIERNRLKTSPGDSYQWFRDGVAIEGATDIEYVATQPGEYTVEVTFGDCVSTADPFTISSVLGLDPTAKPDMIIYPNPVGDYFKIQTEATPKSISFFNVNGKQFSVNMRNGYFELAELPAGIYYIRIDTDQGTFQSRFVKK